MQQMTMHLKIIYIENKIMKVIDLFMDCMPFDVQLKFWLKFYTLYISHAFLNVENEQKLN